MGKVIKYGEADFEVQSRDQWKGDLLPAEPTIQYITKYNQLKEAPHTRS